MKCLLAALVLFNGLIISAADLPRILILGDSISIGYTPYVREMFKEKAVVIRPATKAVSAENCEGTTRGLEAIDRWLALEGGPWDVIHFNFGLHDLKRVHPETKVNSNDPSHPRQAEPEVYERQLRAIVEKLKATGASLIFATTTPVPPGGVKPHRDVEDPDRYNAIARNIMREHHIAVNDLYEFILPKLSQYQLPINVHFSKEGSQALASEVVKALQFSLEQRKKPSRGP